MAETVTDVVETVVETAAGVVANDLGLPEIAIEQSPARLNALSLMMALTSDGQN